MDILCVLCVSAVNLFLSGCPLPSLVKNHRFDLGETRHEVHRHAFPDMLLQLLEIPPVGLRQDQFTNAGTLCRDHFLLDAADRQHVAGQGQLPGHRQRAHRTAPPGK